jgi:predicted nucleic acid-binding protein
MSGIRLVSDTNPLIYVLKGNEPLSPIAFEALDGKQVWISVISELELFGKKDLQEKEIDEIQRLVESCFVIDINAEIKALTKTILQKYSFKLPDAIIAATAIYLDCPLLTADVAFHKVKELTVIHLSFED